jgi:hypothetical protein
MKTFPYNSIFAKITIKPIVSQDKDKYLAMASLEEVRAFLPKIDSASNVDVLPVAFNACVVNRVNKNDDVIDTATALATYKNFLFKQINVEHNRKNVIGVILTAGFSEFGTDKPLTEDQVKGMSGPFNITLGGLVWRIVDSDLANLIEDSNDPTSGNYMKVSASWELGFTDYKIVLMPKGQKNLENGTIIEDAEEINKYKNKLSNLGGDGTTIDDQHVCRMPCVDVLPLGIGFTERPAADVEGVATALASDDTEAGKKKKKVKADDLKDMDSDDAKKKKKKVKADDDDDSSDNDDDSNAAREILKKHMEDLKAGKITKEQFEEKAGCNLLSAVERLGEDINLIQNNISQVTNSNVNIEENNIKYMKITSVKDITDESLKQTTASAIAEFIQSELTKKSGEWEIEKGSLNKQLTDSKATSDQLTEKQKELEKQIVNLTAAVDTFNKEKADREKVEKFNVRMGEVSETYNLDDEVRAAIAEELKALASDEDYDKWKKKAGILLKGFAKKKDEGKKTDQTTASVDDAIDKGKQDKGGPPNSSTANEPTLKEKFKAAFAKENFVIKI